MASGDNTFLNMPWGTTGAPVASPDATAAPAPDQQPAPQQQPPLPPGGTQLGSPGPSQTPQSPDVTSGPMPGILSTGDYTQPANRGGVVKNLLTRMFYGMGQAGLAHVGLPTDYDMQRTAFQQSLQQNELALKQQQQAYAQQVVPVTDPNTLQTYYVHPSQMGALTVALARGGYQQAATALRVRYQHSPYGIIDTHADTGGEPEIIAGTAGPTVTINQDQINKYGIDPQYLGATVPSAQFNQILNAASKWAPTSRTGVSYQTDQYGNIVPMPTYGTTQRGAPAPRGALPVPSGAIPTVPSPASSSAVPPAVQNVVPPTSSAGRAFAGAGQAAPTGPPRGGLVGKSAMDSVVGIDADGNQILTSRGAAQDLGLNNLQKADANTVTSALKARRWMTDLASIPGVNPQTNPMGAGITQLINDLDRRGMLGPLAGRFNEFMAGTWGQGDPEYQALRTKLDLSNTLLASVHTGSRGGWNLIDNFKNLADQGKLSGAALKAAYGSEMDYVRRTQMLPRQGAGGGAAAGPKPGDIQGGYKFNGGNPADPNNWVKQ